MSVDRILAKWQDPVHGYGKSPRAMFVNSFIASCGWGTTKPPAGPDTWLAKSWHQGQGELMSVLS